MDEDSCVGVQGESSSLYEGEQFYEVSQFSNEAGESDASGSHDRSCPESFIVGGIADLSGIEATETHLLASIHKRLEKGDSQALQHQQAQMSLLQIQKRQEPEQMSTKVELTIWKDQFCKNQETIELLKQEKQQLEDHVSSLNSQLSRIRENAQNSEAKLKLVQRELEVGTEQHSSWKFEQKEVERRFQESTRKANQDWQQRQKQFESEVKFIPELERKLIERQAELVKMSEKYESLRDRHNKTELKLKITEKKVDTLSKQKTAEKTDFKNKLLARDQQIKVLHKDLQSMQIHLQFSMQEQNRLNESFCAFENKIRTLEQEKKDLQNEGSSILQGLEEQEQQAEAIDNEKRNCSQINLSMSKVYNSHTSTSKNQQNQYLQLFFQTLSKYRGTISSQQLINFRLKISFLLADQ